MMCVVIGVLRRSVTADELRSRYDDDDDDDDAVVLRIGVRQIIITRGTTTQQHLQGSVDDIVPG